MALQEHGTRTLILAEPDLRRSLERYVRSKVDAAEVDDIVQATLTDALASENAPEVPDELRRWVRGIARHKIADLYRGRRRNVPIGGKYDEFVGEERAPHSARDLLRWAHQALSDERSDPHTFEWMLREGSGEKLEDIAREQGVPAPRVRQRVSRLRRFLRLRWEAQLAAVAALVLVVGVVAVVTFSERQAPPIAKEEVPRVDPAEALRERALESCQARKWRQCLDLLDRAAELDRAGDGRAEIREARAAASQALAEQAPEPRPLPTPTVTPSPAPDTERAQPKPRRKMVPKQPPPKLAPKQGKTQSPRDLEDEPFDNKSPSLPEQTQQQQRAPSDNVQQRAQPIPQNIAPEMGDLETQKAN